MSKRRATDIVKHLDRRTAAGLRAIARREGRSPADALRDLVETGLAGETKASGAARPTKLIKRDKALPALVAVSAVSVAIRAGVTFGARKFSRVTAVTAPQGGYVAGTDYGVVVSKNRVQAVALSGALAIASDMIGGFHFAPGGNAPVKGGGGGNDKPSVNPHSLWDLKFRPVCPDPRGMSCVAMPSGKRFWCDIYLTGVNHLTDGTSKLGVTIADGSDLPGKPGGGAFDRFDYDAACALMQHHGKGLLGVEEFFEAAYGVTEKSAVKRDPKSTALDAPRTSRWGLMQATGNMYVWGHDNHPDVPRASFFGGSWLNVDGVAGSRLAYVAYVWPDNSDRSLGARGRSDHLQPV